MNDAAFARLLPISKTYTVSIGGTPITVYRFDPKEDEHRVDFAWFHGASGQEVVVSIPEPIRHQRIEPVTYEIPLRVQDNEVTFNAGDYPYLQLSLNQQHKLILILDPKAYERPDLSLGDVIDVTTLGASGRAEDEVTEVVQAALDTVARNGGTLYFPAGVYTVQRLRPGSNTHIYLDHGAIIQTVPDARVYPSFRDRVGDKRGREDFIHIHGKENVTIEGPGIILANGIDLALSAGAPEPMPYPHGEIENVKFSLMVIKAEASRQVAIRDVLVLESTEWAITCFDCEDVEVSRARVINYVNWFWSDGVHLTSCRNGLVEDCYAYCGDDGFVATTRVANAPSRNLVFRRNLVGFTTCTGFRVGWYARSPMDDVLIEDNLVISAGRGIDVLHYGYSSEPIRNITIRDMVVEAINDDGSRWQNRCPIFLEMRDHNGTPGMISKVTIENFHCLGFGPNPSTVKGWNADACFSDVHFRNVEIGGRRVLDPESGRIEIDPWSRNVDFA